MATPDWLAHNPWKATKTAKSFKYFDPLEDEKRTFKTRVVSAGTLDVPSGELVATSEVMELTLDDENGGFFRIPPGTYEVKLTLAKEDGNEELAYLSLVGKGRESSRVVADRVGGEESGAGIFFVDKYLLALSDRQALQTAFDEDEEAFESFVEDGLGAERPTKGLRRPLPGGEAELLSFRAPNGIAAAVAGLKKNGDLVALHFVFFVIGSTGEDGEFLSEEERESIVESIWVDKDNPGDVSVERLQSLTQLIDVSVSDQAEFGDAHVAALTNASGLTRLHLKNTAITRASLDHLEAWPKLEELRLSGSAVDDTWLEQVGRLTHLTELDLSDTAISDAGLEHVGRLSQLSKVWFHGCEGMTSALIERMRAIAPEVWIGLPEGGEPVKPNSEVCPKCGKFSKAWINGVCSPCFFAG